MPLRVSSFIFFFLSWRLLLLLQLLPLSFLLHLLHLSSSVSFSFRAESKKEVRWVVLRAAGGGRIAAWLDDRVRAEDVAAAALEIDPVVRRHAQIVAEEGRLTGSRQLQRRLLWWSGKR